MASPYRRPNRFRAAAKRHPVMLAVGIVCALAVVVEVGAVTNFFGLLHPAAKTTGPSGPDLNPYGEMFFGVTSEVKYASGSNYFPELEGQPICGSTCPGLPIVYAGYSPVVIGLFFYFNVTNTGSRTANFTLPALGLTGPNSAGFVLVTYCCYTTTNTKYSEPLTTGLQLSALGSDGSEVGLRAFIYTTESLPQTMSGGYSFYYNVTATD